MWGLRRGFAEELTEMARELEIGEVIVNTIVWDHRKRLRSYELLAGAFGIGDGVEMREAAIAG